MNFEFSRQKSIFLVKLQDVKVVQCSGTFAKYNFIQICSILGAKKIVKRAKKSQSVDDFRATIHPHANIMNENRRFYPLNVGISF